MSSKTNNNKRPRESIQQNQSNNRTPTSSNNNNNNNKQQRTQSTTKSTAAAAAVDSDSPTNTATGQIELLDDSLIRAERHKDLYNPLPSIFTIAFNSNATINNPASINGKSYIKQLISELLPTTTSGQSNYNLKLHHKQLMLDNNSSSSTSTSSKLINKPINTGTAGAAASTKLKPMSRRDRRKYGLDSINRSTAQYNHFLPLHRLWLDYINDLLTDSLIQGTAADKILKADWHGSIITVNQSKSPVLIGLKGIIIRETAETIELINEFNDWKLIPKKGSIFTMKFNKSINNSSNSNNSTVSSNQIYEFEIYGNHCCYRSSERSVKKFKYKPTIELN